MTADENRRAGATAAKARALLGALSLMVLGGVIGIAVDRHYFSSDRHGPAVAFHDMAMSSLAERLDLEPAQRQQIDSILGARHQTLRRTWQTLHAQLGAAVDTVHRDIEAVLTPEQRTEFREWLRDANARQ
ncbi:MAG: hypothetical protein ACRELV_05360 [Longimicrobiales bacterium]